MLLSVPRPFADRRYLVRQRRLDNAEPDTLIAG
jgi:hypothetical protein